MKFVPVAGSSAAFSLVEVVLALGVTTFCIIVLFGLLSVGLRSNQTTIEQVAASSVLSAAVSDLYATPATLPPGAATNSVQFNISIPATPVTSATPVTTLYFIANSLTTNASSAQAAYRLTITPIIPTAPGTTSPAKVANFFDLKVTWPASASVTSAVGSVETFVALNRN